MDSIALVDGPTLAHGSPPPRPLPRRPPGRTHRRGGRLPPDASSLQPAARRRHTWLRATGDPALVARWVGHCVGSSLPCTPNASTAPTTKPSSASGTRPDHGSAVAWRPTVHKPRGNRGSAGDQTARHPIGFDLQTGLTATNRTAKSTCQRPLTEGGRCWIRTSVALRNDFTDRQQNRFPLGKTVLTPASRDHIGIKQPTLIAYNQTLSNVRRFWRREGWVCNGNGVSGGLHQ